MTLSFSVVMMARSSGSIVVDVVLRERDAIAALSAVVRSIRRFADAVLYTKPKRAIASQARTHRNVCEATSVEDVLAAHSEDERLDLHEGGRPHDEPKLLLPNPASTKGVDDVLQYGVQRGILRVVE